MTEQKQDDPLDRGPICALVGPTAAGKTALALAVAERADAEVISLDSMLVYRGMDVGTAKPTAEERARVRHHLIDLVDATDEYDVQRYLRDARSALADVQSRGKRALFVGGTGFYLAALLRGLFDGPPTDVEVRSRLEERARAEGSDALHAELVRSDPESAARIHPNDAKRVVRALEVLEQTGRPLSEWQAEWAGEPKERVRSARLVGLAVPVGELDERIRARTERMLEEGWVEEVRALDARGGLSRSSAQALGYAEVRALAAGEMEPAAAFERIALRTRQFARRQRTWYRKFAIEWIPAPPEGVDRATVERALGVFGWESR